MKKTAHFHSCLFSGGLLILMLVTPAPPAAAQLFGPGDPVLAIDTDVRSSYPGDEAPGKAVDQVSRTKYLNFGQAGTGFIVTPAFGSSLIQSLRLTTANDSPERDPFSYDLYGTNDAIASGDNSLGDQETWTLISSGATGLEVDPGREVAGPIVDFANGSTYTSYKIIFPTLRDSDAANSMQVADVSFFTDLSGGGAQILADMDTALAVTADVLGSFSSYPDSEGPTKAFDGDPGTKYLNFAGKNSGFIVTRADGRPTLVDSFQMTTGNDAQGRDPAAWALYGTDDPITSADNSRGNEENWTLVDEGMVMLPDNRGAVGPLVSVANTTAYGAYRMVFTDLKDTNDPLMQVAEVTFGGTVVPEPSSLLYVLLGLGLCGLRRAIR